MESEAMSPIQIRASRPEESEAVEEVSALATADLRKVYRLKSDPPPFSGLNPGQELVALIEGRVVGTVRYRFEGNRIQAYRLMVHPDFRKRGVARALLDEVARIAEEAGAYCVSLFTIQQTGNVPIFEKLGFEAVSRTPAQDVESVSGRPLTEVFMIRYLHEP